MIKTFLLLCVLQWGAQSVFLSISDVPLRCGDIATWERVGIANGEQQCCRRQHRAVAPPLNRPRPVSSNLESSCGWLDCRANEWNTMKLWFHVPTHFASTVQWQSAIHRTGSCDLWLPTFLCKCSKNSSRMTELLEEACLVIGCSLCNVHFC